MAGLFSEPAVFHRYRHMNWCQIEPEDFTEDFLNSYNRKRKYMKKIISVLLTIVMLMQLTGCRTHVSEDVTLPSFSEEQEDISLGEPATMARSEENEPGSGFMQLQLGASSYCMTVPVSYTNGNVSVADLENDQVGYYYTPDSAMDFDIYQLSKNEEFPTLELFVSDRSETFDGEKLTFKKVNGVPLGYYWSEESYQGVVYPIISCVIEDVDCYVELVFWLDGKNAEKEVLTMIDSICFMETKQIRLGSTSARLTIPADYRLGEITEEEKRNKQIAYYYSESTLLDFDIYQLDMKGDTLESYALKDASDSNAESVEYMEINGNWVAYYRAQKEYDGIKYMVVNYIFVDRTNFVKLTFWLDGEVAVKQTARIIRTLTSDHTVSMEE